MTIAEPLSGLVTCIFTVVTQLHLRLSYFKSASRQADPSDAMIISMSLNLTRVLGLL